MRTVAILLVLLFGLAPRAASADEPSSWWVRCGGPFQLCGYVQPRTEAPRIVPRFQAAKPFRDGLAPVRVDGRWGYIDPGGEVVIEPAFTDAAPFAGRYAEIRIGNASGVIDRRGRVVVPARFQRIIPFADDVFLAMPLESSGTAVGGRGIGTLDTDPTALLGFDDAGLYHLRRGWITDHDLEFSTFGDPARGLIWATRRNPDHDEAWGLMRADGSWQVSPRYSHVQQLMDTRAIVRSLPDDSLPSTERQASVRSGAVDEDGTLVVPLEFAHLTYWRAGYGVTRRQGGAPMRGAQTDAPNAGLVARDGTLLAGRYFDEVDIPEGGALPRVRIGPVWHSIGPGGELLPDQLDGTTLLACPAGPSFIRRGGRVEVRRSGGETVGLFDEGHFTARDCPYPYALSRDDRWFILMPDGKLIGGEQGFESTHGFRGDSTAVKRDGKWGIIDRQGRFTVPPRFNDLRRVGADIYAVGQGDDTQWIDATGRPVPEPQRPRPDPETALACPGGLTFFQANGLWGLRDADDNPVIRPEHRVITCFSHGVAWAVAPGAREWCPIGPDGERRPMYRCRQAVYPQTVSHHAPEPFDQDPFESSVLWNLALLDHLSGQRPEPPRWIPDARGTVSYSVTDGLPEPERMDEVGGPRTARTLMPYVIGAGLLVPVGFVIWHRRRSAAS